MPSPPPLPPSEALELSATEPLILAFSDPFPDPLQTDVLDERAQSLLSPSLLQLPFHDGCYCYRQEAAEQARLSGLTVRCGGGLPCACVPPPPALPPLFPHLSDDAWPSSSPPSSPPPSVATATGKRPRASSPQPTTAAETTASKPCSGCKCPCTALHAAAAAAAAAAATAAVSKLRKCCGGDCRCPPGLCRCPQTAVPTAYRCHQDHVRSLSDSIARSVAAALSIDNSQSMPTSSQPQLSTPPTATPVAPTLSPCCASAGPRHEASTSAVATVNCVDTTAFTPASTPASASAPVPVPVVPRVAPIAPSCCSAPAIVADVKPLLHRSADTATSSAHVPRLPAPAPTPTSQSEPPYATASSSSVQGGTRPSRSSEARSSRSRDRVFACTLCSSTFFFKQNRDRHINEVHLGRRPFKCTHENCNSAFKNLSGLKQHQKTVHEKARPFKCDQCDSAFGQRNHLRQHILVVHDKMKMYSCPVCNMSFSNVGNRTQHMKRRHPHAVAPKTNKSRSDVDKT